MSSVLLPTLDETAKQRSGRFSTPTNQSCGRENRLLGSFAPVNGRRVEKLADTGMSMAQPKMETSSKLPAETVSKLRTLAHDLSNSIETVMQAS
ncbi:MAG TPA: hypothetical protein VE994_13160, partial [Terriglobales bacterium]|nr:hypothetical protein [Terriglobales bacterium]